MEHSHETVQAAQSGDTEAFRRLVETHQQAVYNVVRSLVGDRGYAQDLTQETFIRAYLNLERLKEPRKIRAWLQGIARNTSLKWLARQRPFDRPEAEMAQVHQTAPDEAIRERRMRDRLWRGVYALPYVYRETLLLFYMREMSRAELAEALGVPLTTARSRLHKGRQLLKEVLENMVFETVETLPDDFTDGVLSEAMKQGHTYLAQRQWEPAKQAFMRAADVREDYALAYRGVGLAYRGQMEDRLDEPEGVLDDRLLGQTIDALRRAFRLGDHSPETVWPLIRALRYRSDMETIIALLKKYAATVLDMEQEFLARHHIVDYYAMIHDHPNAVAWHEDLLTRMVAAPKAWLLESLADNTILTSWKAYDRLPAWMDHAAKLYDDLEGTSETCTPRAYYLRCLIEAVYLPEKAYDKALATCARLSSLAGQYQDTWIEARWIHTDVTANRLSIFQATHRCDDAVQMVSDGKRELADYKRFFMELTAKNRHHKITVKSGLFGREERGSLYEFHKRYYQFALHDFACVCMWTGYYTDAADLFEQTLVLQEDPHTHYFYAGCLLKASGDRKRSLIHLRKAVQNPNLSIRYQLKQAFLNETVFEEVWTDEEFLRLIEGVGQGR